MKYKVGDKVWIKSNINKGLYPGTDTHYQINNGEEDIRGKEVEITYIKSSTAMSCKGYDNFHPKMIDEDKMDNIISCEIY